MWGGGGGGGRERRGSLYTLNDIVYFRSLIYLIDNGDSYNVRRADHNKILVVLCLVLLLMTHFELLNNMPCLE